MLEDVISQNLQLQKGKLRSFVVSVSGGGDSTVLLYAMSQLRKKYSLTLKAFHVNFHLRGKESNRDEAVVKKNCKNWKVPCGVHSVCLKKKSQEEARNVRLKLIQSFEEEAEWIEAHHADDQVETFLFRLFRGASPHGLQGMTLYSLREGRSLWRPLLLVPKKELLRYAKKHHLLFCEDSSNQSVKYDRNWIRHEVLPTIEKRFPRARRSMLRLIQLIQLQEQDLKMMEGDPLLVISTEPLTWNWDEARKIPLIFLQRFIHDFFYQKLHISLSFQHVLELSHLIQIGKTFSYNAPRNVVLRGRCKSLTVPQNVIVFYEAKQLLSLKEEAERVTFLKTAL